MKWDLRHNLGLKAIEGLRLLNRYDVSGLSKEEFARARGTIFSEPNQDIVYEEDFRLRTAGAYSQRNTCRGSTTSAQTARRSAYSF